MILTCPFQHAHSKQNSRESQRPLLPAAQLCTSDILKDLKRNLKNTHLQQKELLQPFTSGDVSWHVPNRAPKNI